MELPMIHAIWTIVLMVLFIGIVVWAWSAKRKKQFDEAARLPLEDDDAVSPRPSVEKNHG